MGSAHESIGHTIIETDVVLHASQIGGFFLHHMSTKFTKTTGFGKHIAHGTLTFSIAVGMTANLINPATPSYGYDHMRFVHPVFIGDTIHVKVTLRGKREDPRHPSRGLITETLETFNQNRQLVMVREHIMSCPKKTASA